ncbi:hypothetical protein [Vagococcus carniphilus]|uniref:hypothetical protein n=1 Tax=Vagococcus carniphilus TaxID=218144 RepID=UPI00288D9722|nr:hypothetical protein [Vagococcus carniphilus]MDT2864704.1 hypothetical protein [Vagococcus carniphilus]
MTDKKSSYLPIYLLMGAFFLNDFSIGGVESGGGGSFSDIFILIGIVITITYFKKISLIQFLVSLMTLSVVLINFVIHINLSFDTFTFSNSFTFILKILTYMLYSINTYNYIKLNNLELKTIDILVKSSIVFCLISLYIHLALYTQKLPYEFFWKFTRQDMNSYAYKGSTSIIRMRGLTKEPAHFGMVITAVLGIAYFNDFGYKISKVNDLLITICCILTFSFSTIPIFIMLKVVNHFKKYGINYVLNKKIIISFFTALIIYFIFQDEINTTLFTRLFSLLDGRDTSGTSRLVGSWDYVNNLFIGNGVGQTPVIFNNFAYILSDFGIIPLILFFLFVGYLCYKNMYLGLLLVVFSFQRGGYLSAYYWCMILLFFVSSYKSRVKESSKFKKM